MTGLPLTFSCVGCGDCCRGKHGYISLTLAESASWLRRGHRVAVLIEAVAADEGAESAENPKRASSEPPGVRSSVRAKSGSLGIRVVPTFAGDLLSACPNLGTDNRCGIYADRPLACRIYPAETNPLNLLQTALKACPSDAWNPVGGIPIADERGRAPADVQAMVDRFQRANEDEAEQKALICEALGLTVTAWRGNGFAIHTPPVEAFAEAIAATARMTERGRAASWVVRVHGVELAEELLDLDARLFTGVEAPGHAFVSLGQSRQ